MFTLPTFNLNVNIYRLANYPPGTPDVTAMGNLTPGRRQIPWAGITPVPSVTQDWAPFAFAYLLLPIGTDVRGMNSTSGHDWIECPGASGTWWIVGWVYDAGKGFANEHRVAMIYQIPPYPDPLP